MCGAKMLTSMVTPTTVTTGGTIPLGAAVHGYGRSIRLIGNEIVLNERGYYDVDVSVTAEVTGTAGVTINLCSNGTVIAGASGSATPSEAGALVNISFPWLYRKTGCCDPSALSLTISGAATINEVVVRIEKGV